MTLGVLLGPALASVIRRSGWGTVGAHRRKHVVAAVDTTSLSSMVGIAEVDRQIDDRPVLVSRMCRVGVSYEHHSRRARGSKARSWIDRQQVPAFA